MKKALLAMTFLFAVGCASEAKFTPFKDTVRACFGVDKRTGMSKCEEKDGYTDDTQYHKLYPIERMNLPEPDEV